MNKKVIVAVLAGASAIALGQIMYQAYVTRSAT